MLSVSKIKIIVSFILFVALSLVEIRRPCQFSSFLLFNPVPTPKEQKLPEKPTNIEY